MEMVLDNLETRTAQNCESSGTIEIPNGQAVTIRINVGDKSLKQMQIFTDGNLQFTDREGCSLFSGITNNSPQGAIRVVATESGAGVVQQAYTYINGGIVLDLTPMTLVPKRGDFKFRVTNASGAVRQMQLWILW